MPTHLQIIPSIPLLKLGWMVWNFEQSLLWLSGCFIWLFETSLYTWWWISKKCFNCKPHDAWTNNWSLFRWHTCRWRRKQVAGRSNNHTLAWFSSKKKWVWILCIESLIECGRTEYVFDEIRPGHN